MIFILKREVFNEIHTKYLKVKGRLPKHPITSITDLLTNRSTVHAPNAIHLNDVNQNRVPFPRETDTVPFPRESNQMPFPRETDSVPFPRETDQVPFPRESDQMPLSGNQPTTPRSAQTRSAYY